MVERRPGGAVEQPAAARRHDLDIHHTAATPFNGEGHDGEAAPDGLISGSGGTFTSGGTIGSVTITNQSVKDLIINNIEVANASAVPDIELDSKLVTLNFEIGNELLSSDIVIVNEGASRIGLNGFINNPIGSTQVINEGGLDASSGHILNGSDVLASGGTTGVLRTNVLDMFALGPIGMNTSRVGVELVQSSGLPTVFTAEAGRDIYLDIIGRLRDTNASDLTFDISSVVASRDVDILLQAAVQETQSTGQVGGINVAVTQTQTDSDFVSGIYVQHFTPDPNPATASNLDPRVFADTSLATSLRAPIGLVRSLATTLRLMRLSPVPATPS